MNHYPHHIGDFNNATRHLSRLERSIYRDLLDLYYDSETALPKEIKNISRRILATTKNEIIAIKAVLAEFFVLGDDDLYHNKRCDAEIATFREKSSKAKASAKARWNPDSSNANAMRTHSEGNANQNQNQNQNQLEAAAREAEAAVVETGEEYLARIAATQPADNRRMVVMADGWQPCEKFEDQARMSGIDPELLTSDALAKFRIFYDGQERLANRWNLALIDWLKRERPANAADIRAAKPKPVEKKTEYWTPDPKRMMTPDELAVLHAGRALLK